MGMYDTVFAECPVCRTLVEFQSKAGVCELKKYRLESVPPEVARDIKGDSEICDNCDRVITLGIDRPIPRVAMTISNDDHEGDPDWD
jgi:hypothetical protein